MPIGVGDAESIGMGLDFLGSFAAGASFSAGHQNAQVVAELRRGFPQCPACDRGDTGTVPVEPEDAAEGLKPPGVAESAQHFVRTEFFDDGHGDGTGQMRHTAEQPGRCPAAVQRHTGDAPLWHGTSTHEKVGQQRGVGIDCVGRQIVDAFFPQHVFVDEEVSGADAAVATQNEAGGVCTDFRPP